MEVGIIRNQGELEWFAIDAKNLQVYRVFSNMVTCVGKYIYDFAVTIEISVGDSMGIAAHIQRAKNVVLILWQTRCKKIISNLPSYLGLKTDRFPCR